MSEKNEWKPIDLAPQTGRTLLLGYANSRGNWRTVRGQWMSLEYIEEFCEDPDDVEAGWFETSAEADEGQNCWPINPTHWMDLPAAPGSAPSAPGDAQDELTLAQKYEDACIFANANARDAARYRWLRDPQTDVALVLDKRTGYVPEDERVRGVGGYYTYEYRAGEELDAAIDAALAAQVPQQGEA